jgi:hypothetical protein
LLWSQYENLWIHPSIVTIIKQKNGEVGGARGGYGEKKIAFTLLEGKYQGMVPLG